MNKSQVIIRKADLASSEVQAWMLKEAKKLTNKDAEEVRQEANIKLLKSPRSEFTVAYVRKVIRNCHKTLVERRKREAEVLTAFAKVLRGRILKPRVVDNLVCREILEKIARMVTTVLTEREKQVFVLHVFYRLPHEEIAGLLDIRVPSSKVLLHRARRKLLEETGSVDIL
jgi:RNA polymerase sigma factor (sigma-70 family)